MKQPWRIWIDTSYSYECTKKYDITKTKQGTTKRLHIDVLVPERRNSSALAMELRLSCTDPPIFHNLYFLHKNTLISVWKVNIMKMLQI